MYKWTLMILLLIAKFSTAQINIETGSSEYSVPIFSYADPKSGLSNAISISYSSDQGIKLNQLASNIGLGWSLQAGGEIVRIQNGEPDDQYNPNGLTPLSDATLSDNIYHATSPTLYDDYIPNGYLYKNFDINYLPKQLAFQPRFYDNDDKQYKMAPKAEEDTEQDLFLLNLNGKIKKFKIGRNTFQVKYEDESLLQTQVVIEPESDRTLIQQNIFTKIKGFKITDENGLIYTFDNYDKDELMKVVDSYPKGLQEQRPTGKFIINRWVLTSITDPITNTSIIFTYIPEDWNYVSDVLGGSTILSDNNYDNTTTTVSHIFGVSHTNKLILSSIAFPSQIRVDFTYNTNTRLDLDGSHKLEEITIYKNNELYKSCHLQSKYFFGKNVVTELGLSHSFNSLKKYVYGLGEYLDKQKVHDAYKYRLALTNIELRGKNNLPYFSSSFEYETGKLSTDAGDQVPSRFEFAPLADNSNLSLLQDISLLYAKDNYPYGNEVSAQMGILKKINESSNNSIEFSYKMFRNEQTIGTGTSYVLIDKITYTDKVTNIIKVKMYRYSDYPLDHNINYVSFAYGVSSNNENFSNSYQRYDLIFRRHRNETTTGKSSEKLNASSILKFIVKREINNLIDKISPGSTTILFLAQLAEPGVLDAICYNLFGWGDDELTWHVATYSTKPMYVSNSLPTQLGILREYDVIAGTPILSKEYQYVKGAANVIGYTFPFPAFQRYDPGRIGNLSSITYFDKNGQIVYSKTFDYDYTKTILDDNFLSIKYGVNKYYSDRRYEKPFSDGRIADDWISKAPYKFITGRAYVKSITEVVASSNNSTNATTTTKVSYNQKNNLPNQTYNTGSEGKVKGTNTYYAIDYWDAYTNSTVLSKQKQNNLVNIPVASLSWFKSSEASTSYNITKITIIEYDPTTLQVSNIKASTLQQPLVLTQADIDAFDPYNNSGWLTGVNFTYLQQNTYNNNLLVQSSLNDNSFVSSVVYDYNTYLPAAKVINAVYNDVSYTSFENANKNLLSYSDAGIMKDATSVTGNFLYKLSSGNITRTSPLTSSQKYQITLWAKSGTVLVNGASTTSLITKNGWSFYKFSVTGTTTLIVSGTAYIDELRLYPANAQMSTLTYEPLVGITSSCDENNNIIYNEYDDAGRLSIVRNGDKNIIKKMCYNNLYTSAACNDNGNSYQTKNFYASCGCGYQSNPVPYSVPADKYHSSISQEDADAQAWNEINTYGQSYANSHPSCTPLSAQTVKYTNTPNDGVYVNFINKCTNQTYSYSLTAHTSTTPITLGQLPGGTYDIQIGSNSHQYSHNYSINGLYQGGVTDAYFYNVQFTSTILITVN